MVKLDIDTSQQSANEFYSIGLTCLAMAKKNLFTEPYFLKAAALCFTQSLKANKDHVDALIALAYLLTLFQQSEQALKYLKRGLSLAPNHPIGLELMTKINSSSSDFSVVAEELNFESLLKQKKLNERSE